MKSIRFLLGSWAMLLVLNAGWPLPSWAMNSPKGLVACPLIHDSQPMVFDLGRTSTGPLDWRWVPEPLSKHWQIWMRQQVPQLQPIPQVSRNQSSGISFGRTLGHFHDAIGVQNPTLRTTFESWARHLWNAAISEAKLRHLYADAGFESMNLILSLHQELLNSLTHLTGDLRDLYELSPIRFSKASWLASRPQFSLLKWNMDWSQATQHPESFQLPVPTDQQWALARPNLPLLAEDKTFQEARQKSLSLFHMVYSYWLIRNWAAAKYSNSDFSIQDSPDAEAMSLWRKSLGENPSDFSFPKMRHFKIKRR